MPARGVSLRLDNGPQYTSHHFSHQISHWGRTFRTAAEVRAAVTDFVARYNAAWRLERLGYLSPLDYRARHLQQESLAA
jgi:transposase InsO family protein